MRTAHLVDLGRMPYEACADHQQRLAEAVAEGAAPDTLLLVEHPPVLTLGAAFRPENLLLDREEYARREIDVLPTGRGGDVTYHGPGQLVMYPVFDVSRFGKDLHKWLRDLEETMIVTLASFGLDGERFPPNTGAWTKGRKIAALGVKIRRWVSFHGLALNCDLDLAPFGLIVPCGIHGHGVTSLSQELGRQVTVEEAKPSVAEAFERVFDIRFIPMSEGI